MFLSFSFSLWRQLHASPIDWLSPPRLWSCNSKTKQKPPLHSNWRSSFAVATQLFHSERASSAPLGLRCWSNSSSYDDPRCSVAKAYLVNSIALVTPRAFLQSLDHSRSMSSLSFCVSARCNSTGTKKTAADGAGVSSPWIHWAVTPVLLFIYMK